MSGRLNICGDEPAAGELRRKFASSDSTLTIGELDSLMEQFIKAAEDGTFKGSGSGEIFTLRLFLLPSKAATNSFS